MARAKAGDIISALKGVLRTAVPLLRRPGVARKLHGIADRLRDIPVRLRLSGRARARAFAVNLASRVPRVVFVTEDAVFKRELKLAYALKKVGWDVVLLHRNAPLKSIETSLFSEVQQYGSPMEAVELAHKTRTRLFHYFSNAADNTGPALVDHKPGRVLVDYYDYYFGQSDGLASQEEAARPIIANQAYCLARADAVTTKDLQLCYRRRETRTARGRPLLYFPNYCWDRADLPPPRPPDGIVRIVQAAGMAFETMGHEDTGSFRVIEAFVLAGCHVHIYMIPGFGTHIDEPIARKLYANYIALGEKTGRVHFEPVVPPHVLIEQLPRYDYGFNMLNAANFDIPWASHNPVWLGLLSSGRLFDYLDAGIGMIVDGMLRFNGHFFRPTGAYIDGTELLRSGAILEKLQNRPSRKSLLEARHSLAVERHIGRLTRFYEKLI